MPDFSDKAVLDAWTANASPWTDAVRGKKIVSRRLVTDAAVVDAIVQRQPRSLLDIGCGEGWLTRELSARGIDCMGIDAVPALIETARTADEDIQCTTYQCMEYSELAAGAISMKFDVAVCNFSLIGDAATDAVIAAASRLLNHGGALIVQTLHPMTSCGDEPYVDGWRAGSWSGIEGDFAEPAPWYFRTLQSWVDLIVNNDLVVERMIESLRPDTGKPASIVFVCTVSEYDKRHM